MCVADTRAEAEDLARNVSFDYEDLGVVSNMFEAQKQGAPLLHDHWGDNVVLETFTNGGDLDAIADQAPIVIEREFRMSRQATAPMEGAGVVAWLRLMSTAIGSRKMIMAVIVITRTDRDQGKLPIADRRTCIY
jgi:aerobic carbon-monoxide dehydrogenase large subunit